MTSLDLRLYRNIPTASPRIIIMDDVDGLSEEEQTELLDIANSVSGVSHEVKDKKTSWGKYTPSHDEILNYTFSETNLQRSRFSDGTYPVWYGSSDSTNSIEETRFHIERNTRHDLLFQRDFKRVPTPLLKAECERMLFLCHVENDDYFDAKNLKTEIRNYKEIDSYTECFKISNNLIKKSKYPGLCYLSARSKEDIECFAIWKKENILSSVKSFCYTILINLDSSTIIFHEN